MKDLILPDPLAEHYELVSCLKYSEQASTCLIAVRSSGKTVLLIAHRLTTVTHADRICVVQDGRIVESGTSRELLEKGGIFRRMWDNYQTSAQWKVAKEA